MELIDLNELEKIPIREDNYDRENGSADFVSGIETVIEYARQLPKVDAVTVRCGNCLHAYINSFSAMLGTALCKYWTNRSDGVQAVMPQDGYCSYGEPRTPPAENKETASTIPPASGVV